MIHRRSLGNPYSWDEEWTHSLQKKMIKRKQSLVCPRFLWLDPLGLFPLLFVPWLQWSCFFLHLGCQWACAHWQGGLQAYKQDDFNYTGRWERSLSVSYVNWHLEETRTFEVGQEKWSKDGALASFCVQKPSVQPVLLQHRGRSIRDTARGGNQGSLFSYKHFISLPLSANRAN